MHSSPDQLLSVEPHMPSGPPKTVWWWWEGIGRGSQWARAVWWRSHCSWLSLCHSGQLQQLHSMPQALGWIYTWDRLGMCSEGYCSCRVCLSVCLLPRHLTSRAMNHSTNSTRYSASGIGQRVWRLWGFAETAVLESYSMKHKRKNQYANWNRHSSSGFTLSLYLEGTRSHNEGRVSTPAWYLLL